MDWDTLILVKEISIVISMADMLIGSNGMDLIVWGQTEKLDNQI